MQSEVGPPPVHPLLWPAACLLAGLAMAVLAAGPAWRIDLPQFALRFVTGGDFGVLVLLAWLFAFWHELAGRPPPRGLLPWSGPAGATAPALWPAAAALMPVGTLLPIAALIAGLRLAEAWAAAWLPLVALALAASGPVRDSLRQGRTAVPGPWQRFAAGLLVPAAMLLAVGLVLLGSARPLEALALAAVGVPLASGVLLGPRFALRLLGASRQRGVTGTAWLTLWALGGMFLYAAAGLAGLQEAIATLVASHGGAAGRVAGLGVALLFVAGRWVAPLPLLLLALPLLVPAFDAAGFATDWSVVFIALAIGLAATLASGAPAARLALLVPAVLLGVLAGWPDLVLAPARELRFW